MQGSQPNAVGALCPTTRKTRRLRVGVGLPPIHSPCPCSLASPIRVTCAALLSVPCVTTFASCTERSLRVLVLQAASWPALLLDLSWGMLELNCSLSGLACFACAAGGCRIGSLVLEMDGAKRISRSAALFFDAYVCLAGCSTRARLVLGSTLTGCADVGGLGVFALSCGKPSLSLRASLHELLLPLFNLASWATGASLFGSAARALPPRA